MNSILSKTLDIVEATLEFVGFLGDTCIVFTSAIPGTAAPCQIPATTAQIVIFITITVLKALIGISETLYDIIVEGQNDAFEDERQQVTLANVDIVHGNLLSVFNLAQQLKLLFGGVLDALPSNNGENDETQRRLASNCEDAINGVCTNITKVSCKDPNFLCDGTSKNWNYVAFLKYGENSTISPLCFRTVQACFYWLIMNSPLSY